MSAIPKIIHQSYKTPAHPYPHEWQESWQTNHPDWEYRFYTDADNRSLVEEHLPEFLEAYDLFPYNIMRADFARFLYMYLWGGVYVDLDYACLQPLDSLIGTVEHIGIPALPDNRFYQYHNAMLISEPGNEFWLSCAKEAVVYFDQAEHPRVEQLAGPLRIQESLLAHKPAFTTLSQKDVTPIDWGLLVPWGRPSLKALRLVQKLRSADIAAMRNEFPQAYALTLWDHGWSEDPLKQ